MKKSHQHTSASELLSYTTMYGRRDAARTSNTSYIISTADNTARTYTRTREPARRRRRQLVTDGCLLLYRKRVYTYTRDSGHAETKNTRSLVSAQ